MCSGVPGHILSLMKSFRIQHMHYILISKSITPTYVSAFDTSHNATSRCRSQHRTRNNIIQENFNLLEIIYSKNTVHLVTITIHKQQLDAHFILKNCIVL
jgi:hypothetical protein